MKLASKKYFSISEVSEITGVPQYKLRYLEKSDSKIEIFQIRGRRYYTASDVESIKQKFNIRYEEISKNTPICDVNKNVTIIARIDLLIAKFMQLTVY